jgi:glucokinase
MPKALLDISARTGPAAYGGVDLGGTKIQALITDAHYNVLGESRRPTPTTGGPRDIADAIALAVKESAQRAGVDPTALIGVGIGTPGTIDNGSVRAAHNLPGWEGEFPLAAVLQDALGCPVSVDNDVTVATDAEFQLGAGKPYDSLLGVFWGTGVGGGIILDGKPWVGRGAAGEIGHMVVERDGERCPCGRRGCMEAYAGRGPMEEYVHGRVKKGSKTNLYKLMKEHQRDRLTSSIWAKALKSGDTLALQAVDRATDAMGIAIASALNILDVQGVVIGGGLGVRLGEPYAQKIAAAMMPHLFASTRPPNLHVASLGDYGGALGGALLVTRAK